MCQEACGCPEKVSADETEIAPAATATHDDAPCPASMCSLETAERLPG